MQVLPRILECGALGLQHPKTLPNSFVIGSLVTGSSVARVSHNARSFSVFALNNHYQHCLTAYKAFRAFSTSHTLHFARVGFMACFRMLIWHDLRYQYPDRLVDGRNSASKT